jgi:XTP/dITP diphosphohydrolase
MYETTASKPRLILASRNAHKVEELRRIAPWVEWTAMPTELEDPPETADSFVGNAVQKARFVFERTGLPALADDSGIAVDALSGRPGVRSKRYSAEGTDAANNALLLRELGGAEARTARYHCAIALVGPGFSLTHEDTCEGRIGHAGRGGGGFGYDPLFWPDAAPGRTMAELSPAEKDAISHRGRAMRALPELLRRAGLA